MPVSARDLRRGRVFFALAFAGPLVLYLATASGAVQFDDGAQFLLCAREGSAAHPPGFPLWVALANIWLVPFGFFGTATALCAFVSVCSALAIAFLYRAFESLLAQVYPDQPIALAQAAALTAALACAGGATIWQWSNTVEVYSLQLLATALALFGACRSGTTDAPSGRARGTAAPPWHLCTGIGLGIGLANHHVTTVVLLPFLLVLIAHLQRRPLLKTAQAQLPALGIAVGIAAIAYLLLMLRAGGEERFAFGEPSTLARLWHHLSGGFFGDSMFREGVDYGGRAMVLAMVLARHFWLFAIPGVLGLWLTWRSARAVFVFGAGYSAVLFFVQFGRMHTPNMDAGLLPALAGLSIFVAIGGHALGLRRLVLFAVLGLCVQLGLNYSACNRHGYAAGDAVLSDLDASAPERSVLLLTSWELQTLSLLAREERGFRPDLIVLPSSIKGTHRDLFERHYPQFHAAVQSEYEAFLRAIAAVHPDYIYTDYFTLGTATEMQTYAALLQKIFAVAAAERRPVLCDRATIAFLLQTKVVSGNAVTPCGMLFSVGTATKPLPFPRAPDWLEHPFLQHDLCAFGVLHDYHTGVRQIAGYFRHHGQTGLAEAAEAAQREIDAAWQAFLPGKPAPRQGK